MKPIFEIMFLPEAVEYLKSLDRKHYEKILFNIRKVQSGYEPDLFRKLTGGIWEFRTLFEGTHHRLLAFWDKSENLNTLVITSHGFIKKKSKVPEKEVSKAKALRIKYFEDKNKTKKL